MGKERRGPLTRVWTQIHTHPGSFTHDQVYATATREMVVILAGDLASEFQFQEMYGKESP